MAHSKQLAVKWPVPPEAPESIEEGDEPSEAAPGIRIVPTPVQYTKSSIGDRMEAAIVQGIEERHPGLWKRLGKV
jgi:hypothetical protein